MTLPWQGTTPDISSKVDSRYETPGGARQKIEDSLEGFVAKKIAKGVVGAEQINPNLLKQYADIAINAKFETIDLQLKDIVTVNVKDFGAIGDGVTNNTLAFQLATQKLMSLGGGRLQIPSGVYLVGMQKFAGATGKGYAYEAENIIDISGCEYVEIVGNNATIKIDPRLKYGSYDPVTGQPFNATLPFYNTDYQAQIGEIIRLANNGTVKVSNIVLDGSNLELSFGGKWGDDGTQIKGTGLVLDTNKNISIENVKSHHNCLDGLTTLYDYDNGVPSPFITMSNCEFTYNGRQAYSWVGGSNVTAVNCSFNYTGRGGIGSSPQAGLDIEPNTAARNGVFINCEFADNVGIGFVSDRQLSARNISFQNCRFYGTTNFAIFPNSPELKFYDCLISGESVNAYSSPIETDKTLFRDCVFTADNSFNGRPIFGSSVVNFWATQNPILENCSIISNNSSLKVGNLGENVTIKDSFFLQNGSLDTSFLRGSYRGKNRIKIATGGNDPGGLAFNYGTLELVNSFDFTTQAPKVAETFYSKNILGRYFSESILIPIQSSPTNWQLRITFSLEYNVFYSLSVTAVGYFANENRRGLHRVLYSGDTLNSSNSGIVEHQVGIPGFSLGTAPANAFNTLFIPITHTTGSAVALHIEGASMVECAKIELIQI